MHRKKNKNTKSYVALGLMATSVVVSGVVLSSAFVSADDSVVDTITAIVPASCTMSGSGASSHSATTSGGTYTPDIGTTTMNVICNDTAGFSIYAAGFTGDVIGAANSNKLVGTATSGNATIDTGTATGPGYEDVSNWAMKLETDYYATYPITIVDDYDYYSEVPNTYTKVATRLTGTDAGAGATGASLTTTYAAYISRSQPADTYAGQVKYILVHPNNADAPTTFAAAYQSAGKTMRNGYYKMQDMNNTICANVDEYEAGVLIDVRDDSTYTVAKIAGACWMTQNLRITGTVPAEGSNFSGGDFNVSVYDFKTDSNLCRSNPCSHTPDASESSIIGLTAEQIGAWYNYAAVTAGQITSTPSESVASQDICPSGWHLPSYDTRKPAGSIDSLTGSELVKDAFLPVTSRYFNGSNLQGSGEGRWWSTGTTSYLFTLSYQNNNLYSSYIGQYNYSARCVREAN